MMMKQRLLTICVILLLALLPSSALAQIYLFSLDREIVHIFLNEDGTASIDYTFIFTNDIYASPIDFVDVGLPNRYFDPNSISAEVNGVKVTHISEDDYQGEGDSGVAIGLGKFAIQPGESGKVHVFIGTVRRVLRPDSQDKEYVSAVFSPTWFGAKYVQGKTDLSVTFHFPPGVQPEEPRWHAAPQGWPTEPQTGFDPQGRIIYTWSNDQANGYTQYLFGVSFPRRYVPASAIVQPSLWERLGINPEDALGALFCLGSIAFILGLVAFSAWSSQKRELQYLPPKIAIEGHGIKRGLTAVEAAVLMEQPLDKILTMILFAVVKKGAATVTSREPLQLEVVHPLPQGLHPYEVEFLHAFSQESAASRRTALQEMMVNLVSSVSNKMKGFSRRETLAYYRDIVRRAWAQVESAGTPEVKSQKYDEVMEWTMLDGDYDDRTRRVFSGGPVYVPVWWPRYDPIYRRTAGAPTIAPSSSGGGGISLPHLPGSDFAASVVNSVQNFSSSVIGNLTDFTSKVTSKTNPIPVSTSSRYSGRSGGGGCACACACACAGCACACAGGGR
jgi:hypothetical protein